MKKKIILLTVIGIYLTFALSSPIVLAEDTSEDNGGSGIFSSEIQFDVDSEIEEPIQPTGSKEISFKVKFKLLNIGPIAKWFFFNRRIGRVIMFGALQGYFFRFLKQLPKANLTLSVEVPEGCEAKLNVDEVELDYNNEFEAAEAKLTITLDNDVVALQNKEITIKAEYPGQGTIGANSNTTTISFMPAYVSNLSIEAESELSIPPLKETVIPINITNNGNGESSVTIQVADQENWNFTLVHEEITIGVGETKPTMITVIPPKDFDNVPITLTFTPTSTVEDVDESYRQGADVGFTITFNNDGSLKEDDGLDLTVILIIAFVVIIILMLVIIILKKRK